MNVITLGDNPMLVPRTAMELSEAIEALCQEYNIDVFEKEFREVALKCGADPSTLDDGTFNPLQLREDGKKEQYYTFVKLIEGLDTKYRFPEFHQKGNDLRAAFDDQRPEYLYNSLMQQCFPIAAFMSPGQTDMLFMEWFDGAVRAEAPEIIRIEYEWFDGEIRTALIADHPDEITQDYVSCRPINRRWGSTPYDYFLTRYYYVPDKDEWVGIPLNLIRGFAVTTDG